MGVDKQTTINYTYTYPSRLGKCEQKDALNYFFINPNIMYHISFSYNYGYELWLRAHRSPHQEQRWLKYNGKGRTTQNTAEQSTVKESNAFKSLNFLSVSQHRILMYCMPHDSQSTKALHYITLHLTLYSITLQLHNHDILQLFIIIIYHCAIT